MGRTLQQPENGAHAKKIRAFRAFEPFDLWLVRWPKARCEAVSTFQRVTSARIFAEFGESLRAGLGIVLGLALTGLVSGAIAGGWNSPVLLIAPMGASAVLLFGVPASLLAQPRTIIGGNLIAAFVGVSAARCIPSPFLASTVAVGVSFAAMTICRCVHPPSGAIALTAVLGGPQVLAQGYGFLAIPVALNSLVLVLAAYAYNNLTGHSYPHHAHLPAHPHMGLAQTTLEASDYEEVLADYGEVLDIGREDLEVLFRELLARMQEKAGN